MSTPSARRRARVQAVGHRRGVSASSARTGADAALEPRRYLVFNKPYGVLCSFTDPEARRSGKAPRETLADYVPVDGVYAAGRLDFDSEGLMLLTDDGALSHRLTHPDHRHAKHYLVQVEREPDEAALRQLRAGVTIKGGFRTRPAEVDRLGSAPRLWERRTPIRERASVPTAWLSIAISEGRKRQVRQMTALVGHPTLRLVRVAIGPLTVEGLEPGAWRPLTESELAALRRALGWHDDPPNPQGARR